MNCPTVLLLFLLTSSQTAGLCQLDWACSSVNFVLGQVDNITSVSQCRAECAITEGCEFFTFYNSSATAGLADTCHLFSRCVRKPGCTACSSGPRDCEARCPLPEVRGGGWYCDGTNQTNQVSQAASLQSCYYLCEGSALQRLTCLSGTWDHQPDPGEPQRFTCKVNRINTTEKKDKYSTWILVVVGLVGGLTIISAIITLLLLFKTKRVLG